MSDQSLFPARMVILAFSLFLIFSMTLTACNVFTSETSISDEPIAEADEGESPDSGESDEGDLSDPSSEGESGAEADVPPVALACPAEPLEISMFIHHTWDFSPNRDTEMMKVDGHTGALASCKLTVQKDKVKMEDCLIPIVNTGYLNTDDGKCHINTSGFAVITLGEGFCQEGVITLTIIETLDPDAGYEGVMNCPDISQPYLPFYPPTHTTREFSIQIGGMSATESANPDLTGQYKYNKEWTLVSKGLSVPESEE